MNTLDEVKEIIQVAGCIRAFPIYDVQINIYGSKIAMKMAKL